VAIRWRHNASWLGLVADDRRSSISTLTPALYDGLAGVALFLAYLGDLTGEQRYTLLARDACATMLRRSEKSESPIASIGAFDGWGGIIYALTHLGTLWHEPALVMNAEALVERLPSLIKQDDRFDIIGGAAGCIGSLLGLHHVSPSQRTLSVASQCGEHLITHAHPTEAGIGWTVRDQTRPLSGVAHGAAGIAWALLKLAAQSGNERFEAIALGAIAYEHSLFSPQAGNWRDLRARASRTAEGSPGEGNAEFFDTAWCHGAPGIGLARLSTIEHLDNPEVRREIDIALNTTHKQAFGDNHSLCHGDLGNLELLSQAGRVLDDARWRMESDRVASNILRSIAQSGPLCGTPSRVESPGLMNGLAGIGFGLLRLAEPTHVPSVLTLEAPPGI